MDLKHHWQAATLAKNLDAVIRGERVAHHLVKALADVRMRLERRSFEAAGRVRWRGRPIRALDPDAVDPLLRMVARAEAAVHADFPDAHAAEIRDGMKALAVQVKRWAEAGAVDTMAGRVRAGTTNAQAEVLEHIAALIDRRERVSRHDELLARCKKSGELANAG